MEMLGAPLGRLFSFPPNMTLIGLQPEVLVGIIKEHGRFSHVEMDRTDCLTIK